MSRKLIDPLQQVRNSVRSRHFSDTRRSRFQRDPHGCHEEGAPATVPKNARRVLRPTKRGLGDTDHRDTPSKRVIEMGTKAWTCAPVEPNVPVNHDRLRCQLENSQSREKAWELAFPEFTGLVSEYGMLSSDVLPFRLSGCPIGEG